ncbi:MAG: ABC transporter permease [Acidobacteria bacterium]|nr:ABC transporter permease [Acidobacteriota bacterium]
MRRFLLKLVRRRRLQRDLEAELAFHREMAAAHGNPIPLGNGVVIKEDALDLWRFTFLENLWRDVVYGSRGLRRNPALVFSALLSLGLGIGVNTAMFSLGVEFLFSEPSVADTGSLVSIQLGGNSHARVRAVEFMRDSGVFRDVAGENEETFINWNDGAQTRPIFGVVTTKNYFTALGVPMAFGRGILPADPDEVAVLRHRLWQRHFNGDPSIVDRLINLDGRAFTVVGILPANHRTLLGFGFSPDVYIPHHRDDTMLAIHARLKPGMSIAEARAGVVTAAARLDATFPERWKNVNGCRVSPVAGFARLRFERQMLTIGLFFVVLLIVVGLVLLIACVNVASLLLARASARRREMAIRLALGAGRCRLFQQLLVESLILSLTGAGFGLALAQITASLLARIQLPLPLPIRLQIELDWRVALYAAFLAVVATLASGLLPAWQTVKESIVPDFPREGKFRLRRALVAAQVAVSMVVLATGFLFLRNLAASSAISPGFDVRHTLRAEVHLPPAGYKDAKRKALYIEQAVHELEALPGIDAVAAARIIPFTDSTRMGSRLTFPDTGEQVNVRFHWNAITPAFFRAMDIPVRQGRTFCALDRGGRRVVVVNRTFVERYLGKRSPVGSVFLWGPEEKTPHQIVGVVEGTKNLSIGEDAQPQLYEPLAQINNDRTRIQFVLRSATPPVTQLDPVRQVLRRVEPAAGTEVATLYSSIGLAFLPSQVGAALLGSIGVLGLLLAAVGLYGVMVYSVARRTREIGVRMTLGASRGDISRMVLFDSARVTFIGSTIGLFVALFLTRPLAIFLVPGLEPADPLSFCAVVVVLMLTGLVATWGPVRRALAIDPASALRWE